MPLIGRSHLTCTLGTRDQAQAAATARRASVAFDQLVDRLMDALNAGRAPTEAEVAELLQQLFDDIQAMGEIARAARLQPCQASLQPCQEARSDAPTRGNHFERERARLQESLQRLDPEPIGLVIEALLQEKRLAVEPDSVAFDMICRQALKVAILALGVQIDREKGADDDAGLLASLLAGKPLTESRVFMAPVAASLEPSARRRGGTVQDLGWLMGPLLRRALLGVVPEATSPSDDARAAGDGGNHAPDNGAARQPADAGISGSGTTAATRHTPGRITAHVKLCVLELMIQRATAMTWRQIHDLLSPIKAVRYTAEGRTIVRASKISPAAQDVLKKLDISKPKTILDGA